MHPTPRLSWFLDMLGAVVCTAGVAVNLFVAAFGPEGPVFFTAMAALCALGAWCSLSLARDSATARARA